jgi:high-affinity nickel-transport protein
MLSKSLLADASTKTKIVSVLTLLVAGNVLLWLLVWSLSGKFLFLAATGWLAYGFGLRHAVDADHISAIDNTTRKLMQEGKRPVGVGFFFSLGHSTIVLSLCAALALSTAYVQRHMPQWQGVGGVVGTLVSGLFLYVIGIINLIVLWNLFKTFRDISRGKNVEDQHMGDLLDQRGLLGRLFKPLLKMVRHSWQMYFVGFLFGLGFDTASEVGILALSARSGQTGVPFWVIMLLPLLFMAGMCLIDALDGILMLGAYGWAFIKPIRKAYYNLIITSLSVLVAFVVGTYELLQIFESQFALKGRLWSFLDRLPLDNLGYIIIGTFLVGWGLSVLVYKIKKYESA